MPTIDGKILFDANTAVFEKFDNETKFDVVPEAVCVDVWTVDACFPTNFSFIDGIPKHVPNTREQPTIPLAKGINTVFPKLFCLFCLFCLKFAFEVLLEITSKLLLFSSSIMKTSFLFIIRIHNYGESSVKSK